MNPIIQYYYRFIGTVNTIVLLSFVCQTISYILEMTGMFFRPAALWRRTWLTTYPVKLDLINLHFNQNCSPRNPTRVRCEVDQNFGIVRIISITWSVGPTSSRHRPDTRLEWFSVRFVFSATGWFNDNEFLEKNLCVDVWQK